MTLPLPLLRQLQEATPAEAWAAITEHALHVCDTAGQGKPFDAAARLRDEGLRALDAWMAGAGWDLWAEFGAAMPRTADRLIEWWGAIPPGAGAAVLILDGLSLRELPLLREGAAAHGFAVASVEATGAELPGDTNAFAQALGVSSRGTLANNHPPGGFRLGGATTEVADLPWADCAALVKAEPRWLFWHAWPDTRFHSGSSFQALAKNADETFADAAFWAFLRRLATGRRLLVTSDHGYAHIGSFQDTHDDQKTWLRGVFGGGRTAADGETGAWSPPLALAVDGRQSRVRLPLGRRKWPVPGGNASLSHGGLTLLEALSPFIELRLQDSSNAT
ncbi:hypothetical protein [Sediminicoccus rosea]|uniref:PglZ domain-containing protein n=1 Tax=Sediminicoccus rosea TaxID=1225128 RepID=A0ABZ0PL66_9PROT|nr:hypothetical protein [Sediminicoccus rosea]WPB86479.1 hypothetical protein R9Z33_06280 [Sediminicoccus rosea]